MIATQLSNLQNLQKHCKGFQTDSTHPLLAWDDWEESLTRDTSEDHQVLLDLIYPHIRTSKIHHQQNASNPTSMSKGLDIWRRLSGLQEGYPAQYLFKPAKLGFRKCPCQYPHYPPTSSIQTPSQKRNKA